MAELEDMKAARAEQARRDRRVRAAACAVFAAAVLVALVCLAAFRGAFAFVGAGPSSVPDGAEVAVQIVTDSEGRSVEVPAEPTSIAVMDSFSGELAVMAGAGSRLCGVPGGVASDAVLQTIYPELAEKPVSLGGNAVNIETLAALSCDVAVVKGTLSDKERAKLERVGIPYVVVSYTTMDQQIAAMRLVGKVCGADAQRKADALAAYYEQTIATVEACAAQIPEDERLSVYHAINDALLTDSAGSLGADWIERTGCVDVSSREKATSGSDYTTTLEQVYTWKPNLVICNVADTARKLASDDKWAGLDAVAAGRVHLVPTGATRWGQRGDVETYLAMLWLGCTAYPAYYADIDLKQTVVDYYRDYLGIDVGDELYEAMLAGSLREAGSGPGGGSGAGVGAGTGSGKGGAGTGAGKGGGS